MSTGMSDPLQGLVSESREVNWDRKETEPCESGTFGCCVDHNVDAGGCETW